MSKSSSVHWVDETLFEIDITLHLRKLGIGGIKCYRDRMEVELIYFDYGVTVYYPLDMNHEDKLLVHVLESELLRWEGPEGERIHDEMIADICNHLDENHEAIMRSIEKLKS